MFPFDLSPVLVSALAFVLLVVIAIAIWVASPRR